MSMLGCYFSGSLYTPPTEILTGGGEHAETLPDSGIIGVSGSALP